MTSEYQHLKWFYNFQTFLKRRGIKHYKKYASAIFDKYFDISLCRIDEKKTIELKAGMFFKKHERGFKENQSKLEAARVLKPHRSSHYSNFKISDVAIKYLKEAHSEYNGLESIKLVSKKENEMLLEKLEKMEAKMEANQLEMKDMLEGLINGTTTEEEVKSHLWLVVNKDD